MRKRSATAGPTLSTPASRAVQTAPAAADAEKRYRGGTISESVTAEEASAPATNPTCTAVVSHPICPAESPHASASSGPTAVALNHSDCTAPTPISRQRLYCADTDQSSAFAAFGRYSRLIARHFPVVKR